MQEAPIKLLAVLGSVGDPAALLSRLAPGALGRDALPHGQWACATPIRRKKLMNAAREILPSPGAAGRSSGCGEVDWP